jgi:cytochrome c biogenesis protein CcmG/thiol:disulfide interchange protein DsbE
MHFSFPKKTLAVGTVVIIVLFLVLCATNIKTIYAQQGASDFTLSDLSGNMVSLKDFRGEIVFVDFWATWCLPCRKSLPELSSLDKKYRDKGLVILGLSIDDPDSYDNQYVSNFISKYNIEYRILRADQKVIGQYLGTEDVNVPTLFIVDKEGKILEKHVGFESGVLEKILQKLLKNN